MTGQIRKGSRVRTRKGEVGGVIAVWSETHDEGFGRLRTYAWARVKLDSGRSVPALFSQLEVVE